MELSEMLRCLKALRRREKAHEDTKDAIFFAGACRRQINHFDIISILWDLVKGVLIPLIRDTYCH